MLFVLVALAACNQKDDDNNDISQLEGNSVPTTGFNAPNSYTGYSLVWADEFNGNSLNAEDWNYELGNVGPLGNIGWGNNELQFYKTDNVSVGNGYLTIEARQETDGSYSSGRITTRDKQEHEYGRIDVRAALPNQKGMWPAIWMLGENHLEVGWPICGEIDIVEAFISGPETANRIKSNAFWGFTFPAPNAPSQDFVLSSGDFSDEWHVFSLEWDSQFLRFFVNGVQHHELFINQELGLHFRHKFFFLLNVAVGGNPVENPDDTTEFPQRMYVDYIRLYQR